MRSPKDVLALGQAIVCELGLDDRGNVLERWLAHHLAELISEADSAVGPEKAAAEQQAVDVILKLWMHRRALPAAADPLGGYREAIAVLSRLVPDADPWRRHRQHGSYEELLREMFDILARVVIGGVLLTQVTRARSISKAEAKALEDDEVFLQGELARWINLLGSDVEKDVEEQDEDGDSASDFDESRVEWDVHSAIAENLERMQVELSNLLTRWKKMAPDQSELDEDSIGDPEDDE